MSLPWGSVLPTPQPLPVFPLLQGERGLKGTEGDKGDKGEQGMPGEKVQGWGLLSWGPWRAIDRAMDRGTRA